MLMMVSENFSGGVSSIGSMGDECGIKRMREKAFIPLGCPRRGSQTTGKSARYLP